MVSASLDIIDQGVAIVLVNRGVDARSSRRPHGLFLSSEMEEDFSRFGANVEIYQLNCEAMPKHLHSGN